MTWRIPKGKSRSSRIVTRVVLWATPEAAVMVQLPKLTSVATLPETVQTEGGGLVKEIGL